MRYLSIDYGEKRIGVAVSDEGGKLAFPLEILPNDSKIFDNLKDIVSRENITEVVIGETKLISSAVDNFILNLKSYVLLPIHKVGEDLTTLESRRYQEGAADSRAAALILQRYLDKPKLAPSA